MAKLKEFSSKLISPHESPLLLLLLSRFFSLMTLEVLDDSSNFPPINDQFQFLKVSANHLPLAPLAPVPVQILLIFLGI